MRYAGADWLARALKRELSPFEAKAADVLGAAWHGLYHLEDESHGVTRGEWTSRHVFVRVDRGMATFDFDQLTRLVVLAHDACIRLELAPQSNRYMRLGLWPRERAGGVAERHPTIEAAIETCRKNFVDLRSEGER